MQPLRAGTQRLLRIIACEIRRSIIRIHCLEGVLMAAVHNPPTITRNNEGVLLDVIGDRVAVKVPSAWTEKRLILAVTTAAPAGGPPPHAHTNEDEAFFVLDGEVEFVLGDTIVPAPVGTFVWAPRNVVHQFRNIGARPARMLTFVTPASLEDFFKLVARPVTDRNAPVPMPSAEDIERVMKACPGFGITMHPEHRATARANAPRLVQSHWVLGSRADVWVGEKETDGRLTAATISVPTLGGVPPHAHRTQDELFYILQGEFNVGLGKQAHRLLPGDTVFIPRGTVHSFSNISAEPGRFLSVHTPAGFERFFAEAGEVVTNDDCPPVPPQSILARLPEIADRNGMDLM
jgi:quercetin dioxygenase-like cupin family protein